MAVSSPIGTPEQAAAPSPWPGFYYGYWIMGGAFISQLITVAMTQSVVGPFVTPMTHDLGWSYTDFFYGQSLSRFVMAGVGLFIGAQMDKHGARRFILAGGFVLAGALFLTGSITQLWQWLILRGVVLTIGAALAGGLVVNVMMSKWWVTRRGRMIGYSSMGVSFAGVTFPTISTFLITHWGWPMAWRILAGITLLALIPIALLIRRQPEDYGWHPDGLSQAQVSAGQGAAAAQDYAQSFTRGEALRTRSLYLIILAFGLGGAGITVIQVQSVPFLTDSGFSETFAGLMSVAISLPALLSKPFWGWTTEHLAPKNAALVGFLQAAVGMTMAVVAAQSGVTWVLVAGYVMLGWGIGGQIPLQETIWGSYFGRRYIGSVRSTALPLSLALGAGAPLAVAKYRDVVGNYSGVFYALAGAWALAALVVWFVSAPKKRELASVEAVALSAPPSA